MVEEGKSAIFAFHANEGMVIAFKDALSRRGYSSCDSVTTAVELMERHTARLQPYDLYVMDVNLGYPGSYTFTAALTLYESIHPSVQAGNVLFYSASVDPRIVDAAKKEGLPAITKNELSDIIWGMPRI